MTRTRAGQRRAVARGASWESDLDRLHALYASQGTAIVVRCPPPARVVRTPGGPRIVHVAEGPPDYLGAVVVAGRAVPVMLEAKSCATVRWPIANLPAHQAERLDAWIRLGGVGAVLLRHGPTATCWVLPWLFGPRLLRSRWVFGSNAGGGQLVATPCRPTARRRAGEASLGVDDLAVLGARFDRSGWLAPLLRIATRSPPTWRNPEQPVPAGHRGSERLPARLACGHKGNHRRDRARPARGVVPRAGAATQTRQRRGGSAAAAGVAKCTEEGVMRRFVIELVRTREEWSDVVLAVPDDWEMATVRKWAVANPGVVEAAAGKWRAADPDDAVTDAVVPADCEERADLAVDEDGVSRDPTDDDQPHPTPPPDDA